MTLNIAVLNIGRMGAPMAQRLCQAGLNVHVWNRTPDKAQALMRYGAATHDQVQDAVREADIVISLLESDPIVNHVLFEMGAAQALQSGSLMLDMATIKPA